MTARGERPPGGGEGSRSSVARLFERALWGSRLIVLVAVVFREAVPVRIEAIRFAYREHRGPSPVRSRGFVRPRWPLRRCSLAADS